MIRLREIVREVLQVLGLSCRPQKQDQEQVEEKCTVLDCWGEMADMARKGTKS
jgi:hypothetical protein